MGGGGRNGYKPEGTKPKPEQEASEPSGGAENGYGSPRSMKDAMETVNPHFGEERAYGINCQRCALAYEEQRKGLAVEAQPNRDKDLVRKGELDYERGSIWSIRNYYPDGFEGYANAYEGQHWDTIDNSGKASNAVQRLTSALESHGDGARFMVAVTWKGGVDGHVFNAEIVNGTAVFVDAQSNKVRDITSTLEGSVLKGSWKPRFCRVDNLKLKDGVRDWAFIDIK